MFVWTCFVKGSTWDFIKDPFMVNPMKKERLIENENFLIKTRNQLRKGDVMTFKKFLIILGNLTKELK